MYFSWDHDPADSDVMMDETIPLSQDNKSLICVQLVNRKAFVSSGPDFSVNQLVVEVDAKRNSVDLSLLDESAGEDQNQKLLRIANEILFKKMTLLKTIDSKQLRARFEKMQQRGWASFMGARAAGGRFDHILVIPGSSTVTSEGDCKRGGRSYNGGDGRDLTALLATFQQEDRERARVDTIEEDRRIFKTNRKKERERVIAAEAKEDVYCYCLKGRKAHSPDDFYECNRKMCPAGGLVHKKCAELTGDYDKTWMCKFCTKMPANEKMFKTTKTKPKVTKRKRESSQNEQKQTKKVKVSCEECEAEDASVSCELCGSFCSICDIKLHSKGKRANHLRTAISSIPPSPPSPFSPPTLTVSKNTQRTCIQCLGVLLETQTHNCSGCKSPVHLSMLVYGNFN